MNTTINMVLLYWKYIDWNWGGYYEERRILAGIFTGCP